MPLNVRVRGVEIPIGLGLITLFLFTLACINVFTKELATIAGVGFTLAFFLVFTLSEKMNRKEHARTRQDLEQFRLDQSVEVSQQSLHARSGNVLVACRNPFHLEHLEKTLAKTDTRKVDIVVLSVHRVTAAASGEYDLNADQIFAVAEQDLFTRVVSIAEKAGKHVELLAVAAADPWLGMVQTAQRLQSSRIVTGLSPLFADNPAEQGKIVGEAWEQLEHPRPSLSLEVVSARGYQVAVFQSRSASPPPVAGGYRSGASALAGIERVRNRGEASPPRCDRGRAAPPRSATARGAGTGRAGRHRPGGEAARRRASRGKAATVAVKRERKSAVNL